MSLETSLLTIAEPRPSHDGKGRLRLTLDLDGFEPDHGSLAGFARHLLAKGLLPEDTETADAEARWRAAETVERLFGASAWSAALVGLGLQLGTALPDLAAALEAAERGLGAAAPADAREALAGMLRHVASAAGLLVAVADAAELPLTFRRWLAATFPPAGDVELEMGPVPRETDPIAVEVRAGSLVGRLLRLLALCGGCAPVDLLLDDLGVAPEERDDLLDALEGVELKGGEPLLQDFEYRHPSFPQHLVYGFRDPRFADALADAIAAGMPEPERQEAARSLHAVLSVALGPGSRGAERLLLELARGFRGEIEADLHARTLAWWVDREEVAELKALLAVELREGGLADETLWSVVERVAGPSPGWPVFRCLALLDAAAGELAGAPPRRRGDHHLLRASLLRREGRQVDAYEEARQAAGFYEQDGAWPREAARAHHLAARAALDLRQPEAAKHHWELAIEVLERGHGATAEVSALRRSLADLAAATGDWAAAVAHQEQALRIEEHLLGPDDPRVAAVLRSLAGFAARAGDPAAARRHLERALAIDVLTYGEQHEQVSEGCRMLADLLWQSGERDAARRCQKRALAIEVGLEALCRQLGDEEAAERHRRQAEEIGAAAMLTDGMDRSKERRSHPCARH